MFFHTVLVHGQPVCLNKMYMWWRRSWCRGGRGGLIHGWNVYRGRRRRCGGVNGYMTVRGNRGGHQWHVQVQQRALHCCRSGGDGSDGNGGWQGGKEGGARDGGGVRVYLPQLQRGGVRRWGRKGLALVVAVQVMMVQAIQGGRKQCEQEREQEREKERRDWTGKEGRKERKKNCACGNRDAAGEPPNGGIRFDNPSPSVIFD